MNGLLKPEGIISVRKSSALVVIIKEPIVRVVVAYNLTTVSKTAQDWSGMCRQNVYKLVHNDW